jgi:AcrR family transcriptional regulator
MAKKADRAALIVDVALRLAARDGWQRLSLADIAAEAGISVLQLYTLFRSKTAILEAFHRRIDAAVIASAGEAEGERPRDRLFDAIMRRFDALARYKAAVRAIAHDVSADPLAALSGVPTLINSMGWMLELSGVSASGWRGRARAKLLLGIYLSVLRIWFDDDTADMTKTMAALDARLRRAERWLGLAAGGREEPAAELA